MNEDRDRRIEELLHRGWAKLRIARELGVSRDTVDRVAVRAGFPAKGRGPSAHDWEAIRAYYEAGHSAAATQREFGFSPATWEAAIARGEVVPRPRHAQRPPGKTRQEVEKLLDQGLGVAEIGKRLGVATPTVCYHARKLGVPPKSQFARRYDWAEIQRVYDTGVAMRECKKRFGFSSQTWADAVKRGDIVPRDRLIPLSELLVRGRRTSRGHLKQRLIAAGLKENRCEECGIDEWLGKPLSLQLHHKNGDGTDNRLMNLALLCPNCHSQTDTYGGRNGHRRSKAHLRLLEPPEDSRATATDRI